VQATPINKLTLLRLIHSIWRLGGLASVERRRQSLPRPYWVSRRLFGGQFLVDASASLTQSLLYLWGERLVTERRLISTLLAPGMHAVDVGANVGYYLLLLQQGIGRKGWVTLIEPSEENIPALERNIAINGYSNVVLHRVDVGENAGRVGLRTGINSGVTTLDGGAYQVDLRPLDELTDTRVDFLKIDVEGFEGQVLRGARRTLEQDRPVLFLELHPELSPRFGHTTSDIIAEVSDLYGGAVEFYRDATRDLKPLMRLAVRYGLIDPVQQVVDPLQYMADLPAGEAGTIWLVAGRRP
jgi:FkbM family methyltransferase